MDTRQFVKRKKATKILNSKPIKDTVSEKKKRKHQSWIAGFGGMKAVERMLAGDEAKKATN